MTTLSTDVLLNAGNNNDNYLLNNQQVLSFIMIIISILNRYVRSALELEHSNDESRQRGSAEASATRRRGLALTDEAKEDQLLPDLKPKPGTQLRFTDIPEQFYPDDATPAEITKHSLDLSFALNSYLSKMTK